VDKFVAARMEKELTGEELGGWRLAERGAQAAEVRDRGGATQTSMAALT
jgi:hypothetical protein